LTPITSRNSEFVVHKLNDRGFKKAEQVRDLFDNFLNSLMPLLGPSYREVAIIRTKLEEACFFAKKSIAQDPINQNQE
jgi:hypothetical protein